MYIYIYILEDKQQGMSQSLFSTLCFMAEPFIRKLGLGLSNTTQYPIYIQNILIDLHTKYKLLNWIERFPKLSHKDISKLNIYEISITRRYHCSLLLILLVRVPIVSSVRGGGGGEGEGVCMSWCCWSSSCSGSPRCCPPGSGGGRSGREVYQLFRR